MITPFQPPLLYEELFLFPIFLVYKVKVNKIEGLLQIFMDPVCVQESYQSIVQQLQLALAIVLDDNSVISTLVIAISLYLDSSSAPPKPLSNITITCSVVEICLEPYVELINIFKLVNNTLFATMLAMQGRVGHMSIQCIAVERMYMVVSAVTVVIESV